MTKLHYRRVGPRWKHRLWAGTYEVTSTYVTQTPFRLPHRVHLPGAGVLFSYGELWIFKGFRFSPTGPVPDTEAMVSASCTHDLLYTFGRAGLLCDGWRAKADRLLYRQMRKKGSRFYAAVAWAGVRTLYWPMRCLAWLTGRAL